MDALSFVLGVQSRDLRSSQMKDLIFRPPGDKNKNSKLSASAAIYYEDEDDGNDNDNNDVEDHDSSDGDDEEGSKDSEDSDHETEKSSSPASIRSKNDPTKTTAKQRESLNFNVPFIQMGLVITASTVR